MLVVVQWVGYGRDGLIPDRMFKEKRLDVRQPRRMAVVCEGECMGRSLGMNL